MPFGSKNIVYVSSPENIPKVKHWALIKGTSKDDGYGGSTPCVDYVAYLDRAELEADVKELVTAKYQFQSFRVIEVNPLKLEVGISLGSD